MAELIRAEIGAETLLVEGDRGEFTVWLGDRKVASKGLSGFPTPEEVVAALRAAGA